MANFIKPTPGPYVIKANDQESPIEITADGAVMDCSVSFWGMTFGMDFVWEWFELASAGPVLMPIGLAPGFIGFDDTGHGAVVFDNGAGSEFIYAQA